jgi:predicted permease
MRGLRIARLRLRSLWRRDRAEAELSEELRGYLDERIAQGRAAGLSERAARDAAMREMVSVAAVAERCRDTRGLGPLDDLRGDLRFGVRLLRRQPLFAVTAAMSLAVCIGANTTIVTVANRLLFGAPAGVVEPDRLVDISPTMTGRMFTEPLVSWPDLQEIRRRATLLEGVFGYQIELQAMSLVGRNGAERVFGTPVTSNYFSLLGVRPAAGRLFGAGDREEEGASPLVVLSHRFWTRRFDADPRVIGRTIVLTRQPFTVIGVAPEGFKGLSLLVPDVWIPSGMVRLMGESGSTRPTADGGPAMIVGARLKPGVTVGRAAGEMDTIGRALAREHGRRSAPFARIAPPGGGSGLVDVRGEWSLRLGSWTPIPRLMRLPVAGFMTVLLALVSLVLAIACANVAGVLLARATARRREIAVRLAIGAGRGRLIRQLLTETLLLFAFGGAAGLLLARVMTSLLVTQLPSLPVPVDVSFPLDFRVGAFTAGLSLIAAIACGLVPALHASRADVVTALKDDAMALPDRMRLRSAFVVAQVALSLVLVASAGLFIQSLQRTTTLNQSFDPDGVEVAALDLALGGYTSATGRAFAQALRERVRQAPGVQAASLAYLLPGGGAEIFCCGVTVPGVSPPHGQPAFMPMFNIVEPGYFATLRLPMIEGRDFDVSDREGSKRVAIVDETTARRLWPGQSALGRQLLWSSGGNLMARGASGPSTVLKPLEVVGVVPALAGRSRGDEPPLFVYLPLQQEYRERLSLVARGTQGQRLAAELRSALSSIDPNLPILGSRTLADQAGPVVLQLKVSASVSGSVGIVGMVLAAIGIYGVTAYVVTRRTREIGVRIALGAEPGHIIAIVLREGMSLVAMGSAVGLLLALGAGRLMMRQFYGARWVDAGILGVALTLIALVGLIACYVPARRATRIDPIAALRQE